MNDVGYFYGENAVDKDQLLNLVTWDIGHSLNPKKFKTEIHVHDRANKKKIQLWMHVCKHAHEFTTDITRCIHYAKIAITMYAHTHTEIDCFLTSSS